MKNIVEKLGFSLDSPAQSWTSQSRWSGDLLQLPTGIVNFWNMGILENNVLEAYEYIPS